MVTGENMSTLKDISEIESSLIDPELKAAFIDLYWWQRGTDDWSKDCFNFILFYLMGKADNDNRKRLKNGWPELYLAYESWYLSENENEFLNKIERNFIVKK